MTSAMDKIVDSLRYGYPNYCPRNDGGHEPAYPRFGIVNGEKVACYALLLNQPPANAGVEGDFPAQVWWPCVYCGLIFWEPLEVAKVKAEREKQRG